MDSALFVDYNRHKKAGEFQFSGFTILKQNTKYVSLCFQ